MFKENMIDIIWESECTNGEDAMWQGYKAILMRRDDVMNDIIAYTRVDVVSMMQIWQYTTAIGMRFESKFIDPSEKTKTKK